MYADAGNTFHLVLNALPGAGRFGAHASQVIWELLMNERERESVALHAACLMPDHLHVVVSPRTVSILRWVQGFKSFSTRQVAGEARLRAIWQPSFYDRLVRDVEDFANVVRYVVSNPAVAGVTNAESWPWVWVAEEHGWVASRTC